MAAVNTPKILTIRIRSSYADSLILWKRNPATPFQFVAFTHVTSDEYDQLVASPEHIWYSETMKSMRSNAHQKMQA